MPEATPELSPAAIQQMILDTGAFDDIDGEPAPAPVKKTAKAPVVAQVEDDDQAQPDEEASDEVDESEEVEVPDDQEASPQDQSDEEVTWDELKDVEIEIPSKVDGVEKVEKVTLEQLRNERMMQADYQRKTQQLATREREVEQLAGQYKQQYETKYAEDLRVVEALLVQALTPQLQNVDLNRLASENPSEWARLTQARNDLGAAVNQVRQHMTQVQQSQKAEYEARYAQAARQASETLQREIPGWTSQELQRGLVELAQGYGFSIDELQTMIDPRAFKVLHDAYQYSKLKNSKPAVTKKVVSPLRKLKPSARQTDQEVNQTRQKELMKKLKKSSGRDQDLVAAQMLLERGLFND